MRLASGIVENGVKFEYPQEGSNFVVVNASERDLSLLDLDRELVIDLFKSFGAVLFRGFCADVERFAKFADLFVSSAVRNRAPGRKLVHKASKIQTVNLGGEAFPLHPEMSQTFLRPEICFFFCQQSPKVNGATTICDGTQIAAGLRPATRELLMRKRLRYRCVLSPNDFLSLVEGRFRTLKEALTDEKISGVFKFERGTRGVPQILFSSTLGRALARLLNLRPDRIIQDSILPCLYKPLFCEKLAFGNFILFSRYLHKRRDYPTFEDAGLIPEALIEEVKELSDRLTCAVQWHKGDLLMLDNTRFMHGRNKVDDVRERIIYTRFGMANFK